LVKPPSTRCSYYFRPKLIVSPPLSESLLMAGTYPIHLTEKASPTVEHDSFSFCVILSNCYPQHKATVTNFLPHTVLRRASLFHNSLSILVKSQKNKQICSQTNTDKHSLACICNLEPQTPNFKHYYHTKVLFLTDPHIYHLAYKFPGRFELVCMNGPY